MDGFRTKLGHFIGRQNHPPGTHSKPLGCKEHPMRCNQAIDDGPSPSGRWGHSKIYALCCLIGVPALCLAEDLRIICSHVYITLKHMWHQIKHIRAGNGHDSQPTTSVSLIHGPGPGMSLHSVYEMFYCHVLPATTIKQRRILRRRLNASQCHNMS